MKKLLCIFYIFISFTVYSGNPKVTFISPNSPGNPFWDKVTSYMKITAEQLDVDLRVLYPTNSFRFETLKILEKELESLNKPDYLIYLYPNQIGEKMLKLAEKNGVYTFLFNGDISEDEKIKVGKVEERFKHWIGHIYPDDFDAGYQLAKALIEEADRKNLRAKDGKIHIAALTGSRDSDVSNDRNMGLKKAVLESKDAVIDQLFYTYWDAKKAEQMVPSLYNRYPDLSIFWTASDSIALGVIKACERLGKTAGDDYLVGGIDWTEAGLEAIKNNKMALSMGGHFLEGANVLMFIKNHADGDSAASLSELYPIQTKMGIINKKNIAKYERILHEENFSKIDFNRILEENNDELRSGNLNIFNIMKE